MRVPLTMVIIAIAVFVSPLAYGQASGRGQTGTQGTGAKPSGPAVDGGDTFIPSKEPVVAPSSDALKNLARGGYADPNYVPPTGIAWSARGGRGPRAALSVTASTRLSRINAVTAILALEPQLTGSKRSR